MRKLLLAMMLALATTAFTAAPALALHPDVPHGDYEEDNWEPVSGFVGDNDFAVDGNRIWHWKTPSGTFSCQVPALSGFGRTVGTVPFYSYLMINAFTLSGSQTCLSLNQNQAIQNGWPGALCKHEPTGELWLYQSLSWTNPTINMAVFGRVYQDDADHLTVKIGDGSYTDTGIPGWEATALLPLQFDSNVNLTPINNGWCGFGNNLS